MGRAEPLSGSTNSRFTRWTWATKFSRGIRGWMSYPLPQDVGFDPTLSTARIDGKPCLVQNIKSYGQSILHVGIIRPLAFRVTEQSVFKVRYELKMGGPVEHLALMLAAENGRLYRAPLPHEPGMNSVTVQGTSLGVPAAGTAVQAVLIEATVRSPVLDSSNRLFLHRLEIIAERHRTLPLLKPELAYSAAVETPVAVHPVKLGGPLVVEVRSRAAFKVSVDDAAGKRVPIEQKRVESAGQTMTDEISFKRTLRPGVWKAVVDSGPARSEFQFLVLGPVPAHPRVLLTARRLEQLRSQYSSSPLLAALRTKARDLRSALTYSKYAGRNIALLPGVSVFPGLPEYFTLLEDYSDSIAFNAVEYRLTGDEAALNAARKGLMTVTSWPTWTPTWFTAHGLHTYYEVGVFSQGIAVGYDLIADQLTPAEKEHITEGMWRNGIQPTVEEYFSNNRMPIAASNWMANSVGGALASVVALYGDLPDWNARLGTALAELSVAYDRLLRGLFPGDGSEAEPAGYQAFAMEGISFGMASLHALGIRPRGTEKVMQSFWWPRYAEVTPDLVLDTGDFGGQLRALSGFAWEAEHSHDPSLRAFYDTAEEGRLSGISKKQYTGRFLATTPGLLDLTCCTEPAKPAPAAPTSRIFPKRGSAVLRSGWKSTDTVISLRVGPWFNHEHHDQGSFQVAAFGRKLISEAGYANYYTDPNYPTYFMQASGHNTVLMDDNPFSQPGENGRYWKAMAHYPHLTAQVLSPDVDYLSAQLAEAYDGVLNSFQREYIFLKPDVLIVHDRIEAPSTHHYEWLLHIPIGAARSIRGRNAFITVQPAAAALTSLGPNDVWTLHKTPLAADRYGNFDRIRLHQPYEFMLNSDKSTNTSFLVGMKFERAEQPLKALVPIDEDGQEGFRDPEGGWSWVSRPQSGDLKMEGYSARGQSLGIRKSPGSVEVFGTSLTSLRRNSKRLLESSSAVDLSLQRTEHAENLNFYAQQKTSLEIATAREPREILLDGHPVRPTVHAGLIALKDIGKGEHLVAIRH